MRKKKRRQFELERLEQRHLLTAVAADDVVSVDEDHVYSGNVLVDNGQGVDTESNGQSLSVSSTPVSQPSHGTVTISSNGNFAYTPTADFWGADSFQYRVGNGSPGGNDTGTVHITVRPVNDPPSPIDFEFTVPEDSGRIRIAVITDDIVANDDDRDPMELVSITALGSSAGSTSFDLFTIFYTPAPNFSGDDVFTYTLTDAQQFPAVAGLQGSAQITIHVTPSNDAPRAANDNFRSVGGAAVTGNVLVDNGHGADWDIDGDALSISTSPVSGPSHGTLTLNVNGSFSYVPDLGFGGTDTFTYRMSDGKLTDTAEVRIDVDGVPVAKNDAFSGNEDGVLAGNVLANNGSGADFDPDGDVLLIKTTAVTAPVNGQLTLNANGTFTYSPSPNFNGLDSFVYALQGGAGDSAHGTVSLTIDAVNDRPIANDDAFSVDFGNQASGNLLADNGLGADFDADGDLLQVLAIPAVAPQHGAVTLNSNGTFGYVPDDGFSGSDSFDYRINDGELQDTATVRITVASSSNRLPLANDDTFSVEEDRSFDGNLLADNGHGVDADPDGQALTVTLVAGPTAADLQLKSDGSFSFTPVADFHGDQSFKYRIDDGQGGVADATAYVTVIPVNDLPDTKDDFFTVLQETQLHGNVLADNGAGADSDIEDADLVAGTSRSRLPSHGTLALMPNGSFTYVPRAGFVGVDTFGYTASDSMGGFASATVRISVTADDSNLAPIANDDVFQGEEDGVIIGNVLGDNGNGADTDPNDDDLIVSDTVNSAPQFGSVVIAADGQFSYTPDPDYFGTDSFTYLLGDGRGGSDIATVHLTVSSSNDLPVAADDFFTVASNGVLSGSVLTDNGRGADSDPDQGGLTVGRTRLRPRLGRLTLNEDGTFEYQPLVSSGVDRFSYSILDMNGDVDFGVIEVTIEDAEQGAFKLNSISTDSPNGEKAASDSVFLSGTYSGSGDSAFPVTMIDWGDGSPPELIDVLTAGLIQAGHAYQNSGEYTVKVFISDGSAAGDSIITSVQVGDDSSLAAPRVVGSEKNEGRSQHDALESFSVAFSSAVDSGLESSDLVILRSDGETVDTSSATVHWTPGTNTATWDFTAIAFEVDRYTVRLRSSDLQDAQGRALDGNGDGITGGDFETSVVVTWAGDTDLNMTVEFADFLRLSTFFGQSETSWMDGDTNADGSVDFSDFLQLSANFGRQFVLPDPASSEPLATLELTSESSESKTLPVDFALADEHDWIE